MKKIAHPTSIAGIAGIASISAGIASVVPGPKSSKIINSKKDVNNRTFDLAARDKRRKKNKIKKINHFKCLSGNGKNINFDGVRPSYKNGGVYYDLKSWSNGFKKVKNRKQSCNPMHNEVLNNFYELIENPKMDYFCIGIKDLTRILARISLGLPLEKEVLQRFGHVDPHTGRIGQWYKTIDTMTEEGILELMKEYPSTLNSWYMLPLDHCLTLKNDIFSLDFNLGDHWISSLDDDIDQIAHMLYFLLINGVMTENMFDRIRLLESIENQETFSKQDTLEQICHSVPLLDGYYA